MSGKVYFITSIVPGAELHQGFVRSIEQFCKKRKAQLLLIPTKPTVHKDDTLPDELLQFDNVVLNDRKLNSKLFISNVEIDPALVDPVSGLQRQSQKDGSFIFASPKQRLKLIPNGSNVKMPHAIMTPGAATLPYYKDSKKGRIAHSDHIIGGLVVEIESDKVYHFRQIQAAPDGSFVDLAVKYTPRGVQKTKAKVAALVQGDTHVGETDPLVEKATYEMMDYFNPEILVEHDLFTGRSVNRHEVGKNFTRGQLGQFASLEYELKLNYEYLLKKSKKSKQIIVVRSNHDMWIDTYIEDARYIDCPINYRIGHLLAIDKIDGKIPLEAGIRRFDTKNQLKNVKFLKLGDDLRITPKKIQIGAHGHQGANGARGNPSVIERTYGQSVSAHTHTPEILRGAYIAGTSTKLDLAYTEGGASSWLQAHVVIYEDGSRQLLIMINGKWRADGKRSKQVTHKRSGRRK